MAQNYRERFLSSSKELNLVLEMYCKNDYIAHFLNINLDEISHKQLIDLFCICVRHDSFKIAIHIYLRYMDSKDVDRKLMDVFIQSLRNTTEFHEIKMFFIHQHFDLLTIMQMNDLVDTFNEACTSHDYSQNPILSTYNTIKIALLIYRISWKIT